MVSGLGYGIWGLIGGGIIEGVEFTRAIKVAGDWPWHSPKEPSAPQFIISVIIRLAVGAALAAGLGIGHQIVGVFGGLTAGIAAPLIVEQLAQRVPLSTALQTSEAINVADSSGQAGPLTTQREDTGKVTQGEQDEHQEF